MGNGNDRERKTKTGPSGERRLPVLSKSRYVSGLQCHLKLWYECYERDLASPVDEETQARFDMGHQIGELATLRHPGGDRRGSRWNPASLRVEGSTLQARQDLSRRGPCGSRSRVDTTRVRP